MDAYVLLYRSGVLMWKVRGEFELLRVIGRRRYGDVVMKYQIFGINSNSWLYVLQEKSIETMPEHVRCPFFAFQ